MNTNTRTAPELKEIIELMDEKLKASPNTVEVYNDFMLSMKEYAKDDKGFETDKFNFFWKSWRHSAQQNNNNSYGQLSTFDFCKQVYCAYYSKVFAKETDSNIQKGFYKQPGIREQDPRMGSPKSKQKMRM